MSVVCHRSICRSVRCDHHSLTQTPPTRSRRGFFFKNGDICSPNTATVHRKWIFLNTLSRVENFLKRRFIVFVWMCENGVFQIQLNSCQSSKLARPHIRFKNVTCGRRFSKIERKESPFSKIPGYLWTVKNNSKTLRVDANIFKN